MTILTTALSAIVCCIGSATAGEQYQFDILVRGGTLIDGTGALGRPADVGITDGTIVFVGDAGAAEASVLIDASGLTVAPGFIDSHNHAEDVITDPLYRLNDEYLLQGVTTIIGSPDGNYSPSHLRKTIYAFEKNGIGTNYAFYVGHNGIRLEVMGMAPRAATPDELAQMRALVEEGMEIGALGLSSGLMMVPGIYAPTDEVVQLASVAGKFDGVYDTHTRDPVNDMTGSEAEGIEIGRLAGVPVKLGHLKAVGLRNRGNIGEVIRMVNAARSRGEEVVADQYPYDGAATEYLHDVFSVPDRQWGVGKSLEEFKLLLGDSSFLSDLRRSTEVTGGLGGFSMIKAVGYDSLRVVDAPSNRALEGRYLVHLARDSGRSPFDEIVHQVLENKSPILVTYGAIDEQDVLDLMLQPWVMIASDGTYERTAKPIWAPHPRSLGTFPRVLGHYVRDKDHLAIAEAIRKMTSFPAEFNRLFDRGVIRTGCVADLVVFDARTIVDRSTWSTPTELPVGVSTVIVNGQVSVAEGRLTGIAAGRVLRRVDRQSSEAKACRPDLSMRQ